jgi:protein SCO1/2
MPLHRSCLVLLAALVALVSANETSARRLDGSYFPNVPVIDQNGRTLRFYDDVLAGQRVVVSFIFTTCRDVCPLITARLAQVRERLGPDLHDEIRFVSISVDPKTDTPTRLKEYAEAFGIGSNWLFLTGTEADIQLIRKKLGDRAGALVDHRQDIWLGDDTTAQWARDSAFSDLSTLTHTIIDLLPDLRDRERGGGGAPVVPVTGIKPGQALFQKACASCHSIGPGTARVGPNLAGVTRRRTMDWITGYIMDPRAFHRRGDPIARELEAQFKSVRMPYLGLGANDAADLIAYIEAQTFVSEAAPSSHASQPAVGPLGVAPRRSLYGRW